MNVLVLQHIACEPPGVFEDVLLERGATLQRVELDEGEPLPASLDGIDAIVAMGGPMSVNDEAEHPWLVAEKALIARAVRGRRPVLGLVPRRAAPRLVARRPGATRARPPRSACSRSTRRPRLRDGSRSSPASRGRGRRCSGTRTRSTFPRAPRSSRRSPDYPHQAFRVGRVAYGVQFHVEVDEAMADEWARVPAYVASAEAVLGPGGLDRLLADFRASMSEMQADGRVLFSRWVDLWA